MDYFYNEYSNNNEYNEYTPCDHGQQSHFDQRDQALLNMKFPGKFRLNQRELSKTVYQHVCSGSTLLLEAPTGIGKSLGVLFPALKAMPKKKLDKLFVLNMRTTGRLAIIDDLKKLLTAQPHPTPLRVLELSARKNMCQRPEIFCNHSICDLAVEEHLQPAAISALVENWMDQNCIKQVADQNRVCPYYLAQSLIDKADIIVADVNLFLSRHARLYNMLKEHKWRIGLLIDECHNLIERVRGMYSETLSEGNLTDLINHLPPTLRKTHNDTLTAWQSLHDYNSEQNAMNDTDRRTEYQLNYTPLVLCRCLEKLCHQIRELGPLRSMKPPVNDFVLKAEAFMYLSESLGDKALYVLEVMQSGSNESPTTTSSLSVNLLVPADAISQRFSYAQTSILFSATLNPPDYYRDVLGLPKHTNFKQISAPYKSSQVEIKIAPLNTGFRYRTTTLQPIAKCIEQQYRSKPGNYMIFLSSLKYMNQIHDEFQKLYPDIPTIIQTSKMSEQKRLNFINEFKSKRGLIGFAVLGGIFSEGVDLPGDNLIGVSIVTLSLQPRSVVTNALYLRNVNLFGEERASNYTYLYPAMCRICQAAGRLIRSPTDTGTITLIDSRYLRPDIQGLLPDFWELKHNHDLL